MMVPEVDFISMVPEKVTEVAPPEMSPLPDRKASVSEAASPVQDLEIEGVDLSLEARAHIQAAKYQYYMAYMLLATMNSPIDMNAITDNYSPPDHTEKVPDVNSIDPMMFEAEATSPFLHSLPSRPAVGRPVTVGSDSGPGSLSGLMKFLDFFSPEQTSHRILLLVAGLFSASDLLKAQGNTRVARKTFAATVRRLVDQGLGMMWFPWENLPPLVRDELDKTKALVTAALQTFEESGGENETDITPESARDLIADFFRDSAQCFKVLEQTFVSASYNAQGRLHLITTPAFSVKA